MGLELLESAVTWLPGGAGRRARAWRLRRAAASLGARPCLEIGVVVTGAERVSIGDGFAMLRFGCLAAHDGGRITIGHRVSINENVNVGASEAGEIVIGDDVLIGPNTVLRASNHAFASRATPINRQGHVAGRISVGEGAWIGANCSILSGVTIGAHAIVGAGAVVTKDVAAYDIVAGVPARRIGTRP